MRKIARLYLSSEREKERNLNSKTTNQSVGRINCIICQHFELAHFSKLNLPSGCLIPGVIDVKKSTGVMKTS
jgi:hypothetical protein